MRNHSYLNWFGKTASIYWHDTAVEQERLDALTNGAVGMTTNPFLVQSTLNRDRDFWRERLEKLPKGLSGDEKAEALTHVVIDYYSRAFMPWYEKKLPYEGFVCAQLNPLKSGDADYMIEQGKRFASWGKNVMLKIPASNAGLEAIEECVALGFHVTSTVTLTVPQIMAAAEAEKRGRKRAEASGIIPGTTCIVMQPGRLDDYLRDTAHDVRANVSESDIIQAGLACSKKAYILLQEGGYESLLLFAGFRSANQITEMAGAKAVFTIPTAVAEWIPVDAPKEERVNEPVPGEVIERLLKLPEFQKAWFADGMKQSEFITYGAYNRTIDQLINDGWNLLVNYNL